MKSARSAMLDWLDISAVYNTSRGCNYGFLCNNCSKNYPCSGDSCGSVISGGSGGDNTGGCATFSYVELQ